MGGITHNVGFDMIAVHIAHGRVRHAVYTGTRGGMNLSDPRLSQGTRLSAAEFNERFLPSRLQSVLHSRLLTKELPTSK
jgi:hypothetical protein